MAKNWKEQRAILLKDPAVRQLLQEVELERTLAHELLKARVAKGLTQTELADAAGISQVIVARLESGTANPTVNTVARVASVLGKELKLVSLSSRS